MPERLVFTARSGAENDAAAAILLLRARAAKKSNVQLGLSASFHRVLLNSCFAESARALSVPIFGVSTLNALAIVAPGC
ncbi:hypothetical protein [Leisingera sp. M523]|uniref:hypothetical protein n=1 Tax=Leisingera sp. M523 TaxID=2867013 RepID=UPI0021A49023|nr:hypothetical protein [Leisingera sp. M523]UWQ30033.1 hypothetical protein K3557_05670 [Leisingera sp. M523]